MACPNCGSDKTVRFQSNIGIGHSDSFNNVGIGTGNFSPFRAEPNSFPYSIMSIFNNHGEIVASLAVCENCGIFYNGERNLTKEEQKSIKIIKEEVDKNNKMKFISDARKE